MKKPHISIIIFRYMIVGSLMYGIWTGQPWAYKVMLTLVILHSELIYITNRLKEAVGESQS